MDVDVDTIGRDADEQVDLRTALLDRRNAVGFGDCVRDCTVLDDAAVDEHVLSTANRTLIAKCGDVAVNLKPCRFLAHLDQVQAFSEELKESLAKSVGGR